MAKSDAELVAEALNDEPGAFEEIVRRHQKLVFNIIYHYLGRRDGAEDLAQEVFLKVYRSLGGFDTTRPMEPWIARITANSCLDFLRRLRSQKATLFTDLATDDEDRMKDFFDRAAQGEVLSVEETETTLKLLYRALAELNEKDRMAFVLREMEGMSYGEVAQALDLTELAARIRVSRARKRLQERLEGVLLGQMG